MISSMDPKAFQKLAGLARIDIEAKELGQIQKDIGAILQYVSRIQEIASSTSRGDVQGGHEALSNVMREDEEPHESGAYSKELLAEVPRTKDGYIQVKKIL